MRLNDKIDVWLNTAFKRTREDLPIYSGHNFVKLAEWSRESGYRKISDTAWEDSITYVIPCPIVAIVDKKIREDNLTLTITGNVAEEYGEETYEQIGKTITKKTWTTSSNTETIEWEVPRFTRKNAVFLLSGLGKRIYEISNITSNVSLPDEGGIISFYGLASEGSKVLYYLGMNKIQNMILEIVKSIWQHPTKCPRCDGTGIVNNERCPQCDGYRYSGYNATKNIQIKKGYDVGLTREKFGSYPLTNDQDNKVWEFVNRSWTQYWWVTPTKSEIRRLFAHFYQVGENEIIIEERHHLQMPHWDISLPDEVSFGAPFDVDRELMRFIARSITPAGVTVFIGFYQIKIFGTLDGIQDDHLFGYEYLDSAMDHMHHLYGFRYDLWNGWNEATDNFEREGTGNVGNWTYSNAYIRHPNDRFRHMLSLEGSGAYAETGFVTRTSGNLEFWCHPYTSSWRCEFLDGTTGFWIGYEQSQTGFVDSNGRFHAMMSDNEAFLKVSFDSGVYDIYVNRTLKSTGVGDVNVSSIRFINTSNGTGLFDCIGLGWDASYEVGDAWQDLYTWGWGINHADDVSGVSGLYENYFRKRIPFWF